jgi:endonuclease/exonuclease/phosphatase family metal-dependent hydrolase
VASAVSRRILAAAAILAAGSCAGTTRGPVELPLRVATYNIQAGGGNLDSIAAAIRALDVDIIGLQEVDVHWSARSHFADQMTELAGKLGLHARFGAIYRIPNTDAAQPWRQFGVALLTRYPIVESRNNLLTRLSTQDTTAVPQPMPGLLEAIVDVKGNRVRVFSTHLDYRADPAVRATQAMDMRGYVERSTEPTIVFGDLNAGPDAPELRPLFAVLRDVWTSSTDAGLTYPAAQPVKRIDYVLISPGFTVQRAFVPQTLAADHRPVVAELILRIR